MVIPNKFWIFILSSFDGPNRSKRLICPINFVFYPNITIKKKVETWNYLLKPLHFCNYSPFLVALNVAGPNFDLLDCVRAGYVSLSGEAGGCNIRIRCWRPALYRRRLAHACAPPHLESRTTGVTGGLVARLCDWQAFSQLEMIRCGYLLLYLSVMERLCWMLLIVQALQYLFCFYLPMYWMHWFIDNSKVNRTLKCL